MFSEAYGQMDAEVGVMKIKSQSIMHNEMSSLAVLGVVQ